MASREAALAHALFPHPPLCSTLVIARCSIGLLNITNTRLETRFGNGSGDGGEACCKPGFCWPRGRVLRVCDVGRGQGRSSAALGRLACRRAVERAPSSVRACSSPVP